MNADSVVQASSPAWRRASQSPAPQELISYLPSALDRFQAYDICTNLHTKPNCGVLRTRLHIRGNHQFPIDLPTCLAGIEIYLPLELIHISLAKRGLDFDDNDPAVFDDDVQLDLVGNAENFSGGIDVQKPFGSESGFL